MPIDRFGRTLWRREGYAFDAFLSERATRHTFSFFGSVMLPSLVCSFSVGRSARGMTARDAVRPTGPTTMGASADERAQPPARPPLPRFLHVLTTIHALGAIACLVMAIGSALSTEFRSSLAVSGGSRLMIALFGEWTWAFLLFVGTVLAILAWASWRVRPWAWELTLVVYGIGVVGSIWQVSVGIPQGWVAALVNGAVVVYAARPAVRRAYMGG